MSILYEFYRNPNSEGTNKKRYHARVVSYNNISTERLAKEIQKECSLTHVDVEAVLMTLADKLAEYLGNGQKVHLKGIGQFQVNLRCKEEVRTTHAVRSENIEFKSVSFRADSDLKKSLKGQKIKRSRLKPHSFPQTETNIDKLLTKHFETNQVLSRRQFQFLTGQVRATACRTIKKLVEAGKLQNLGTPKNPVYVLGEGYYGCTETVKG